MSKGSALNVVPVILSGGSGSRLWPKSRKSYPKQLHRLYGDATMLQHTYNRIKHLNAPIVVCNESQRFMVADQLSEVSEVKPTILLEPVARNTAPAIAVAAMQALNEFSDPIVVVLPADHQIKDAQAFRLALDAACKKAEQGYLVTFGVVPDKAETGYGYIEASCDAFDGGKVAKFVEKPDRHTAEAYLKEGGYFWNSGIFVFRAELLLEELYEFDASIVEASRASLDGATKDLDFVRLGSGAFSQCRDTSIDYAVMERTSKAWCVPLSCGWSDLGSWQSLYESSDKDSSQNAVHGDVMAVDCHGSMFHSGKRLIAGVGLRDLVVVDTDDAVLVVHKSKTQDVKLIVEQLKEQGRDEFSCHREVYRPWGSYDSIDRGERFQVKRITVKPGASLSLQMHHHRAEHWVVVSGTALVQRGDEEELLAENQSIYIPLGEKHRLTNPGKVVLELIEVQSGSYLGEDDIVRFADGFGRE